MGQRISCEYKCPVSTGFFDGLFSHSLHEWKYRDATWKLHRSSVRASKNSPGLPWWLVICYSSNVAAKLNRRLQSIPNFCICSRLKTGKSEIDPFVNRCVEEYVSMNPCEHARYPACASEYLLLVHVRHTIARYTLALKMFENGLLEVLQIFWAATRHIRNRGIKSIVEPKPVQPTPPNAIQFTSQFDPNPT